MEDDDSDSTNLVTNEFLTSVSDFLLKNNYLLTALELYQECTERGESQSIQNLYNFFHTDKFLSGLNNLTFNRPTAINNLSMASLPRQALEYELRCERENVKELRNELVKFVKPPALLLEDGGECRMVTPLERKALNFCVLKYLKENGFKQTTINFTVEATDCVDDWTEIGSSIGIYKEPSLQLLYQSLVGRVNQINFGHKEALEQYHKDNIDLKLKIEELTLQLDEAQKKINDLQLTQISKPPEPIKEEEEVPEPPLPIKEEEVPEPPLPKKEEDVPPVLVDKTKNLTKKGRDFTKLLYGDEDDSKIEKLLMELRSFSDPSQFVEIISNSLPAIAKIINPKKEQKLFPLIMASICWNPEKEQRLKLTRLFFDLIPKPDEIQRKAIVKSVEWLARFSVPDRTAEELISESWKPTDPDPEKHILTSEMCGILVPFVNPQRRLTFLFCSVLNQLSEISDASVRQSVAKNSARVLASAEKCDSVQIYEKIEEFVFRPLFDKQFSPREAAKTFLLPVFGNFCEENEMFREPFLRKQLDKIVEMIGEPDHNAKNLCTCFHLLRNFVHPLVEAMYHETSNYASENNIMLAGPKEDIEKEEEEDNVIILVPPPILQVIDEHHQDNTSTISIPHISRFSPSQREYITKLFEYALSEQLEKIRSADKSEPYTSTKSEVIAESPNLYWMVSSFIPELLDFASKIDTGLEEVFQSLCQVLLEISRHSGRVFLSSVLKTIVEEKLDTIRKDIPDAPQIDDIVLKRIRLTTVYVCCILAPTDKEIAINYLRQLIQNIALKEDHWLTTHHSVVSSIINVLCNVSPHCTPLVLNQLCLLATDSNQSVRALAARFLGTLPPEALDDDKISTKILPTLTTLSTDLERHVRQSTIGALGTVAVSTRSPVLLDKVKVQMELLLDSKQRKGQRKFFREFIRVYRKIIPDVADAFLEEFIIPELRKIAEMSRSIRETKKKRILIELLFTYKTITGHEITNMVREQFILPALEIMQKESAQLAKGGSTEKQEFAQLHKQVTLLLEEVKEVLYRKVEVPRRASASSIPVTSKELGQLAQKNGR